MIEKGGIYKREITVDIGLPSRAEIYNDSYFDVKDGHLYIYDKFKINTICVYSPGNWFTVKEELIKEEADQ